MDELMIDASKKDRLAKSEQTARGQDTPVAIPSQGQQPAALAVAEKPQDDAGRESQALAESTMPVKSQPLDTSRRQAGGLSLRAQMAEVHGEPSRPTSLQSEGRREAISETAGQTVPAEQFLRTTTTPKASTRASSSTSAKREAISLEASYFNKMLAKAEQTVDLSEREKIWRNFLTVQPDSTYRALAVFYLAQTLAASSDSSTGSARLEQNLIFFRDNARLIRPLMGRKEFERELARLQALLKWRQSSAAEKP
jgi:hypothetical protein